MLLDKKIEESKEEEKPLLEYREIVESAPKPKEIKVKKTMKRLKKDKDKKKVREIIEESKFTTASNTEKTIDKLIEKRKRK